MPTDYPGLASLCWNRDSARPIDRENLKAFDQSLLVIRQIVLPDERQFARYSAHAVRIRGWRTTALHGRPAACVRSSGTRGQKFWVSRSQMVGLSPLPDPRSAPALIAGGPEIGMAGPIEAFKICRPLAVRASDR